MSEIANLAQYVALQLNNAKILPCEAEFRAYFKQDVEKLRNDVFVFVCPHSEKWELESRSSFSNELIIDVAIQYKLKAESPEKTVEQLGETADTVAKFLFGKSMGPYAWQSTEYYPYHGESLEQIRTFVSIVSTKYYGRTQYQNRARL